MYAMWSRVRSLFQLRSPRQSQSVSTATVQPGYQQRYASVFHKQPDASPAWVHFPFPWGSPESLELQNTIWKIENQVWKRFLQTIHDEGIQGDLVEFGVSAGSSLFGLIGFCEEIGLDMKIYGFDSFEGLPEPSDLDPPWWRKGEFSAPYDEVCRRLRIDERPHVSLVKGWFCDTLSTPEIRNRIRKIAFARIDGDLYQSACESLAFLEDRLADGAYLCFDDWTDDPQTGETRAFFEFADRTRAKYRFEPSCRISLGGMHMRVYHV